MPRIVFMGSPEFAVPSLQTIAESVVGVVTQPDRPAGRGRALTPCPVKQAADELKLPAIQPERLENNRTYFDLLNAEDKTKVGSLIFEDETGSVIFYRESDKSETREGEILPDGSKKNF